MRNLLRSHLRPLRDLRLRVGEVRLVQTSLDTGYVRWECPVSAELEDGALLLREDISLEAYLTPGGRDSGHVWLGSLGRVLRVEDRAEIAQALIAEAYDVLLEEGP